MTCRACHQDHPPMMLCGVARRIAINSRSAINADAINRANGETPLDQPVIPVVAAPTAIGVDSPERRTPNRRAREVYNAYMKDYMRKRRTCQKPAA